MSANLNQNFPRPLRWYEKNAAINDMVEAIQVLPQQYQSTVGLLLCNLMEYIWDNIRYSNKVKEVGVERQIGLLKSQYRRRWYDQDVHMRRAFNRMGLLPEEQLEKLSKQITPALLYVNEYLLFCKESEQPVKEEVVSFLFKLTLEKGDEAGRAYLERIIRPDVEASKNVYDSEAGMKISADM